MKTIAGFIFIFALGLLSIIIALAFSMLVVSRASYSSQRIVQGPGLARLAAKEGVDHAIGVIRRQFDNGKASIPTQLTDAWRSHFWPIEALKDTPANPLGLEHAPADTDENDVHIENGLIDPYSEAYAIESGYRSRKEAYQAGYLVHPGCARWYEPGVQTQNPALKPLSFDRAHPSAAENYTADLNQPLWYDNNFVATEDSAKRRYRLRYAVAVEDLGGHLLVTAPGKYTADDPLPAPAQNVTTLPTPGLPLEVDHARAIEVNQEVAERYAGAIANIVKMGTMSTFAEAYEFADLGLRGMGLPMGKFTYSGTDSVGLLAAWWKDPTHQGMKVWCDFDGPFWQIPVAPAFEVDHRINSTKMTTSGTYFSLGPIPSFYKTWWSQQAQNTCFNPLLLTPFGRVPEKVSAPIAWTQSYSDNPWRINLPTAAPRAITSMVYGYMPREFMSIALRRKVTQQWNDGSGKWDPFLDEVAPPTTPWKVVVKHVNLFRDLDYIGTPVWPRQEGIAYFGARGGVSPGSPYPGTDADVLGGWRVDLGKDTLANEWLGTSTARGVAVMSHVGMTSNYTASFGGDGYTVKESKDKVVDGGGKVTLECHSSTVADWRSNVDYVLNALVTWNNIVYKCILTPPAFPNPGNRPDPLDTVYWAVDDGTWAGYNAYGTPYTKYGGYYYYDSYWLDMHVAMLQAMAVAQYAWADQVAGGVTGDPNSGKPKWPATIDANYFRTPIVPGALTRDRDVDLDGNPDVPSVFDTVKDLDDQFLRNLGEDPTMSGKLPIGLQIVRGDSQCTVPPVVSMVNFLTVRPSATKGGPPVPGKTIKERRLSGDPALIEAAKLMELVVNDMRMSFFGASPGYPDFQPLDLDDDGTVRCSCYPNGFVLATEVAGAAMKRFSVTGYFDFQKSRYYRIFVRGEVFDEVRSVAVAQDNMETVYVVDPDGDVVNGNLNFTPVPNRKTGMSDSHVLFQRHLHNRYLGLRSGVER